MQGARKPANGAYTEVREYCGCSGQHRRWVVFRGPYNNHLSSYAEIDIVLEWETLFSINYQKSLQPLLCL